MLSSDNPSQGWNEDRREMLARVAVQVEERHHENLRRFIGMEKMISELQKDVDRLRAYVIIGLATTLLTFVSVAASALARLH